MGEGGFVFREALIDFLHSVPGIVNCFAFSQQFP